MPKPEAKTTEPTAERIAKRIARAGVCSRREAEVLIEAGRVTVNGKRITSPALNVTAADTILVDGKALKVKEPARVWRFHKPDGCLTTNRDPSGRKTIFDVLPDDLPRTVTIGRLDFTTEGLLLLTNDGDLARWMEHPDSKIGAGWPRRYRVRVHGEITDTIVAKLARGVTIEGVRYRPAELEVEGSKGLNSWVSITLHEGKNREVKRLLQHFGLQVARLIRVSYGPFQLGKLPVGAVEEVPAHVVHDQCAVFFNGK